MRQGGYTGTQLQYKNWLVRIFNNEKIAIILESGKFLSARIASTELGDRDAQAGSGSFQGTGF